MSPKFESIINVVHGFFFFNLIYYMEYMVSIGLKWRVNVLTDISQLIDCFPQFSNYKPRILK